MELFLRITRGNNNNCKKYAIIKQKKNASFKQNDYSEYVRNNINMVQN